MAFGFAVTGIYCSSLVISMLLPNSAKHGWLAFLPTSLGYCGLLQNYAVFAPNPAIQNISFQASLQFADGSSLTIESPDLSTLGQMERAVNHRYRKLFLERLCNSEYRSLLEPYCVWLAAQYKERKPVQISLFRVARPIIPLQSAEAASDKNWEETSELFTYFVGK